MIIKIITQMILQDDILLLIELVTKSNRLVKCLVINQGDHFIYQGTKK